MKVNFTIPGEPTGKGRPKFARVGNGVRTYTPQKTANYETLVKWVYQSECRGVRFADDAMLDVRIVLYFTIPKSVSKKKMDMMLAGQIRPTKKPDIDNSIKLILDSLNGIAYRDDTQVVDCMTRKFYSTAPRVVVTISDFQSEGEGDSREQRPCSRCEWKRIPHWRREHKDGK